MYLELLFTLFVNNNDILFGNLLVESFPDPCVKLEACCAYPLLILYGSGPDVVVKAPDSHLGVQGS